MGASDGRDGPFEGASPSSRPALLRQLAALLRDALEVDVGESPSESTGLLGRGIGLDSIEVLKLAGVIEERFGVEFEDDELEAAHFETLGALTSFLAAKCAK